MEPKMDIAAIKNFNVYEILEPERVHNVKTDILVAIDDDKPNPEIIGSFTDKVNKTEYDLVDLFENIFVSPQHIKRKNEDFEFPDFESDLLDKAFSNNKKETEVTKNNGHISTECIAKNINEYLAFESDKHDIARNENMSTGKNNSSNYLSLLPSSEMTKQYLDFSNSDKKKETKKSEIANFTTPRYTQINSSYFGYPLEPAKNCKNTLKINENVEEETIRTRSLDEILDNVISKKYCLTKLQRLESESFKDEVDTYKEPLNNLYNEVNTEIEVVDPNNKTLTVNHIKPPVNITLEDNSYEVKNTPQYFKAVNVESKLKNPLFDIKHVDTTKLFLEKRAILPKIYQNDIKSSLIDLNKPVITSELKSPIPMLQTVKKDNKAFANGKRRIVKTDKEKAGFTKGPDLYEKSLVLPQIMERLAIRKEYLDAKKNVARKLILDCPNQVIEMPEFSPIILQADCNKERLKNIKTRTAFAEFINSGRIS